MKFIGSLTPVKPVIPFNYQCLLSDRNVRVSASRLTVQRPYVLVIHRPTVSEDPGSGCG